MMSKLGLANTALVPSLALLDFMRFHRPSFSMWGIVYPRKFGWAAKSMGLISLQLAVSSSNDETDACTTTMIINALWFSEWLHVATPCLEPGFQIGPAFVFPYNCAGQYFQRLPDQASTAVVKHIISITIVYLFNCSIYVAGMSNGAVK